MRYLKKNVRISSAIRRRKRSRGTSARIWFASKCFITALYSSFTARYDALLYVFITAKT